MSHDRGVFGHFSDRIAVMYSGEMVEEETTEPVETNPRRKLTPLPPTSPAGEGLVRQRDRHKP